MASIEESILLEESVLDHSNGQELELLEAKDPSLLLGPEDLKEVLAIVKAVFDRAVQSEENIFNKSMDVLKNEHDSMVALYRKELDALNGFGQDSASCSEKIRLEILCSHQDLMDKLEAENERYTKTLKTNMAKLSCSRHEIWMTTVKVYGLMISLANGAVDLKQDPHSLKRLTKSLNQLLLQPDFLDVFALDED